MKRFVVGVDIGGTNTKIAIVSKKGKVLTKSILSTNDYNRRQELIEAIAKATEAILVKKRLNQKNILGLGVGLPGLVDTAGGIVHYLTNIPGWQEVALKVSLQRKTGLNTFIDNDVNLMALAESRFGAGRGAENMICLTLGTGVGGGIILNGRLYRGASLSAGEIGHIPVSESGPRCACGSRGCLERYVGNRYILKEANRRMNKRVNSLEELTKAAKDGNGIAIQVWERIGYYLGVALAGIVNLLNPERIIIGGGVAKAGRPLFDSIRKTINERAFELPAKAVKVVRAGLGEDAGLIGTYLLVEEGIKDEDIH